MAIDYMWQKFHGIINALAIGDEPLKKRLEHALRGGPSARTSAEHLPTDLAEEYQEIYDKVTAVQATGNEGVIAASCRAMTELEAIEAAKDLVSIYDRICHLKAIYEFKRSQNVSGRRRTSRV
jgi:hypothetical protein